MRGAWIFLIFLLLATTPMAEAFDLTALMDKLKQTATADAGVSSEEQKVAEEIQKQGANAVPFLLPLLQDKSQGVRKLAAFTLRDIQGLTEKDLEPLIEAQKRGNGWLPYAIAQIGTPRAVKFLVAELIRNPETMTQITGAISFLGPKAVPELMQVYERGDGWNAAIEAVMYEIFKDMGAKAADAVDPLLKICLDAHRPQDQRVRAIRALNAIGETAEHAGPGLEKLRHEGSTAIQEAAASAIVQIGSPEAVEILTQKLETHPEAWDIRQIAVHGKRCRAAGPAVMKCLTNADWDLQIYAAVALGYIDYQEAQGELVHWLSRKDDWRAVWAAAKSLGKLRSQDALPALQRTAESHWYPRVRNAAKTAIDEIRRPANAQPPAPTPKDDDWRDDFEYPSEMYFGESLEDEEALKLGLPLSPAQAAYASVVIKGPDKTGKPGEKITDVRSVVEVKGGQLTGANHGEWGGETSLVDAEGNSETLIKENTHALYKTPDGIIAITGLAHMSLNYGYIYRIRLKAGKWQAEKWRTLPSAPRFSRMLKDGRLLINCYAGIVALAPDGEMRMLTRAECLAKDQKN